MARIFGILIAVIFLSVSQTASAQRPYYSSELVKNAQNGSALAQFNLGNAYDYGEGVEQDFVEAVKWWRLAAEQGYAAAQNNLGSAYYTGKGTIKDLVYSYMWYNIAASLGWTPAGTVRDWIAPEMTPEQIAEAQKLARECVRKEYKDC